MTVSLRGACFYIGCENHFWLNLFLDYDGVVFLFLDRRITLFGKLRALIRVLKRFAWQDFVTQ